MVATKEGWRCNVWRCKIVRKGYLSEVRITHFGESKSRVLKLKTILGRALEQEEAKLRQHIKSHSLVEFLITRVIYL